MLVKSASHCSGVGTPAVAVAAEGTGLWGGTQGIAIVEGVGVEVALSVQLVIKYY